MKFHLDTEFHEAPGELMLISISLVAEDEREFYAVSSEFDPERCNPWVRKHVLPKLAGEPRLSRAEIRDRILTFVGDATPEFWADYASYDWVLFCWIFGAMIDLPPGWPMFCRDLRQAMEERGLTDKDLPPQPEDAHHALVDARWLRDAHAVVMARPPRPASPILCVTGLVVDGDKVALIRSRKPGRAWELPGGKLTPEDRGDWRVALSREIREETGQQIEPAAWSVTDVFTGPAADGGPATIIVARAAGRGALTAGDDAADAAWVRRDELPSDLSKLESLKALRAWADAPTDTLEDRVRAYCDAVKADQATTAAQRFEGILSLLQHGI